MRNLSSVKIAAVAIITFWSPYNTPMEKALEGSTPIRKKRPDLPSDSGDPLS